MPLESGQVSVELASDAQFQAWMDVSGLNDLVDEDGIEGWSFDDRVRVINFAIKQGRTLNFADENNSDNAVINAEPELFEDDKSPSEAM